MNKSFIASLLIGVEGILLFAFVMPKYSELSGARAALRERETLLQDSQTARQNIASLASQFSKSGSSVAQVLAALPSGRQYDYLVENFRSAAQKSGLQLGALSIGDKASKETKDYAVIPVRAELTGSYPALLAFLDILEKSLRIFDITNLQAVAISAKNLGGSYLNITLQANTYSLR